MHDAKVLVNDTAKHQETSGSKWTHTEDFVNYV